MGTMSHLAQGAYIAHSNNYQKGRNGYKICKFTPHIMAGILTGKQCAVNIFQKANRYASANYCIGNDGDIVCNVYEEDRAYTSSSRTNDNQAITVEVSNCEIGGQWKISDAAWNSLIKLAVDVCRRYNFRLVYDGTPNGSLTRHNMFANTTCPGAYLQSKFQELANTVNAMLDGASTLQPTPEPTSSSAYLVKVTTDALNIRQGVGTGTPVVGCIRDKGTYTIVETQGNWGRLKSGAGWICLDYTKRLDDVPNPSIANNNNFAKGQKVTLKTSANKYCTGQVIPNWVKGKSYTIMQVGSGNTHPDGVLLQEIMSWVYKKDIQ
jgi:hypothetical protein